MLIALKKYIAGMSARAQKGQIIVFTAVLLPLLIAATGFTVDFGNMYMHKSRLQNAADAAAIAGGHSYHDNNEKLNDHPKANEAANKSLELNHPQSDKLTIGYKARSDANGNTFFRVRLEETVPVYFMQVFGVGDNVSVLADGFAKIPADTGGTNNSNSSIFDNLMTVNANGLSFWQANDQNTPNNSSTFDGKIRSTGDVGSYVGCYDLITAYGKKTYSSTRTSQDWAHLEAANKANEPVYNHPETDSSLVLDSELDRLVKLGQSDDAATWKGDQNVSLQTFVNQNPDKSVLYYKTDKDGQQNMQLNINTTLYAATAEEAKKPFYIIMDNEYGQSNISINTGMQAQNLSDTQRSDFLTYSRPIVFIYSGKTELNFSLNNNIFKGIIYTPYTTMFSNDEQFEFYGSIAANKIQMQCRRAQYTYMPILSDGGSGSGGNGSGTGSGTGNSPGISLSDGGNIDWND